MRLSKEDLDRLGDVIGEAERTTAGEIKLVLAKRSTRQPQAATLLWLALTTLGLLALWFERERLIDAPATLVPGLTLGAATLALFLARLSFIERALIPPAERKAAALTRAELEFHREGLTHTRGGTGILLFLSLFEREAVVLADRGIASRVPNETWGGVLKLILEGAGGGNTRERLAEAIRLCGTVLTEQFPATAEDGDEISNAVVVKD